MMKIKYQNKELPLYECKTFFKRFMGFMGKKGINYCLSFNDCNSIHTFFMKENIDVIMCDKNYNIIYYYKDLGKNKVILPKKKVKITFETPKNYFDIKLNTKIEVIK